MRPGALSFMAAAQPKSTEQAVKRTAQAVEQHSRKVAASAAETKHAAAAIETSADLNTRLAADRNVLAAERTYAAWVRTGLFALASGIGARALAGAGELHDADRVLDVLLRRGGLARAQSRSAATGAPAQANSACGADRDERFSRAGVACRIDRDLVRRDARGRARAAAGLTPP